MKFISEFGGSSRIINVRHIVSCRGSSGRFLVELVNGKQYQVSANDYDMLKALVADKKKVRS